MSSTRWYKERKKEGYYKMAKREGYRARSAYKLQQVNEKYGLVREGDAVADLGCAPGGWTQVLVEFVGPDGFVAGIDLQRTRGIQGAVLMQGDFMKAETRQRFSDLMGSRGRKRLDAVVSDMAPDMSGNYELDQVRSVQLAEMALDFAVHHLEAGGHFACKVFEGADFHQFREDVRRQFRSVYQFHPPASRKASSEIYLIAKKFIGAGDGKKDGSGGQDGDEEGGDEADAGVDAETKGSPPSKKPSIGRAAADREAAAAAREQEAKDAAGTSRWKPPASTAAERADPATKARVPARPAKKAGGRVADDDEDTITPGPILPRSKRAKPSKEEE